MTGRASAGSDGVGPSAHAGIAGEGEVLPREAPLAVKCRRQVSNTHTGEGYPYDGRLFSAWMLGCSIVVGNAAIVLVVFPVVIPAAWLAIAGGALMLWPFLLRYL